MLVTLYLAALTIVVVARAGGVPRPPRAIAALIRHYFPRDYERALCIAWHESSYRPRARNGVNLGLMQVSIRAHPYFDARRLLEPRYNLAAARRIYDDAQRRYGDPWRPWTTRTFCRWPS